jgi:hypothetical protein
MNDSELIINLIRHYCANPDDLAKIATAIEVIGEEIQAQSQDNSEDDVAHAERMRSEYPNAEGLNY